MKKLIALLLAAVMLLSMTACGGAAEPVETAPATTEVPTTAPTETPTEEPTEVPTEAPTEPVISAEELLQSDDTVTLTGKTPAEYWQILLDLGYIELCAYENREIPSYPKDYELLSLTYNDYAFRLDFTAIDYWDSGQRYEGFSLYGIREKATGNANITGFNLENGDIYTKSIVSGPIDTGIPEDVTKMLTDANIALPFIKEVNDYSVPMENASEDFDFEKYVLYEMPHIYHASFYYPATGNLYNFVREAHGVLDHWINVPSNMLNTDWREVLGKTWINAGAVHGAVTDTAFTTFFEMYYEEWMTLEDWAASQYNIDGWTWTRLDANNGFLRSADGNWCMLASWVEDENGENRLCTMKDYAEGIYIWMSPKEQVQQFFDSIGKGWSADS